MAHRSLAFTTSAFKNQKLKWKDITITDHRNGKADAKQRCFCMYL